ncbi:Mg2+ transporter protein [Conidiobolus coronatus NRRL 28638]|uniref:Mg2+ transporter protein n=1 Tax=Conidiobolus coronatus (strain ATCC 28846 / CBS 209.66 / NRRL 28638) TaxID=796925 RepID=A0A137P469_CONC2|nr:Mg2+ transporter protein [Conidiobolus coronatus NRRL 28638]|eukprot:KXN69805.1 Mg2+ transporter protein [Conidiobolus coronatus NRRL 28638]
MAENQFDFGVGGDGSGKDNRFLLYSPHTGSVAVNKFSEFQDRNVDVVGAINSDLFWLDVVAPTPQEMVALSKIFKIHPLTVEDIMTEDVREKCELFKHYYFVTFRTFQENNEFQLTGNLIQPLNVYSLVFKSGIVTFHSNYHSLTKSTLRKIDQLKSIVTLSPDWINYSILDEITDNFAPLLRQIELEVDTVDDLVLILKANEQSDMLRRIGYARKKVTTLLRLLTSKPDVIKALTSRTEERIGRARSSGGTDIKLYLGDIQDHLITMVQNLLHYEKVLARAHSNYLAQISIELTQVSNKTNDAVAKLTIIASVLLPMNVITGMWGMNVTVPGQSQDGDTLAWFFGITASMVLIASLFFLYVKKYMLK